MAKIRRPIHTIHEPRTIIRQLRRARQKRTLLPHKDMPPTTPTHGLPNWRNNYLFTLEIHLSDQINSSGSSAGFVVDGQAEAAPPFKSSTDEPVGERVIDLVPRCWCHDGGKTDETNAQVSFKMHQAREARRNLLGE